MAKGAVTGSFDPITIGHLDIIKRASALFKEIIVVALVNPDKNPNLDLLSRKHLIELAIADIPNAKADIYEGMTIDYCNKMGVSYIIRGIRDDKDYFYESAMAEYNREHGGVETILLPARADLIDVKSSELTSTINTDLLDRYLPQAIIDEYIKLKNKGKGK